MRWWTYLLKWWRKTWPAEEYAGIDIFRFDASGRIVEHLSCFLKTEMDHLFLGNFLVSRI
ncbi:hypothetical protein ACFY64_39150 [Streptomyces collinus]|uniref:hypothetical protein n=1 Tax=Streptomyces collinus TaxID=42684 RepID=UPI0036931F81